MVNQPLYTSIQETVPEIARYRAQQGREDLVDSGAGSCKEKLRWGVQGAVVSPAVLQNACGRNQPYEKRDSL